MLVDTLIVFDPPDRAAAEDLRSALENDGASALLYAPGGRQATTAKRLNRMMREAGVVALIVSDRAGAEFWQQDDIATIRSLVADQTQANRIALVAVGVTARSLLPDDLKSATVLDANAAGWRAVARDLTAESRSARRPATVMVGHSMAIVDAIWDDFQTAGTDQLPPDPAGYSQLFENEGNDLVVRSHGQALQRITPDEYEKQLTPGQLEDVARIEKSMEINFAEWKRVYPTRAVNPADRELFVRVQNAIGEDLEAVRHLLETSGFWLDDHYLGIRDALRSASWS